MNELAEHFAAIAEHIQGGRSDGAIQGSIAAAETLARQFARAAGTEDTRTLAMNLTTALETWRTVWPRMGAHRDFRAAVGREAALWARRLGAAGSKTLSHGA